MVDELIAENRFLAARDGMSARLIDLHTGNRIPAAELLERTLAECRVHARALGCERELADVRRLAAASGASRQLAHGRDVRLGRVAARLADAYLPVT